MFKLLTEEHKLKVSRIYSERRAAIALGALTTVILAGIVVFLPSYVLSNAVKNEVKERIRVAESLEGSAPGLNEEIWLQQMNLKLRTLSPRLDNERPSNILKEVLEEKRAGIRITSFSWQKGDEETVISVSGIAQDRQTLIAFQDRLDSSTLFSEVSLPVSNLARDRDINFQLKLYPKQ